MAIDYSKYALDELYSTRASIDAERYPENFAALNAAIAAREAEDPEAASELALPRYASGWRRFGALWIDGLILLLPTLILMALSGRSPATAIAYATVGSVLTPLYQVFFHARTGATPGKKALRIRVLRDDFSPIDLVTALKRSSVELFLAGARAAAGIGAIVSASHLFPVHGSQEVGMILVGNPVYLLCGIVGGIWGWSEIITCLLNKRRKAVHDYIAGTVVVLEPRR